MAEEHPQLHYWERFPRHGEHGTPAHVPPGEDLAALRRGANRLPGSVPAMWRFYAAPDGDGPSPGPELAAEHHALVLFGLHQQGVREPLAHDPGRTIGTALRELRRGPRYRDRETSLDARVAAAATATTLDELAWHLRALVRFLRDEAIGFDYTGLWRDLVAWQQRGGPERVRRRWGRDYFAWGERPAPAATGDTEEENGETTDD